MKKMEGYSKDYIDENINNISKLFPEVITEIKEIINGEEVITKKVNVDALSALLGINYEGTEKYSFLWHGKYNALKNSQIPSAGTFIFEKSKSKNSENTSNFYLEADNLEALKLLQKTYYNRIKMIYIDPPYNTGHDFVYKDNFVNSISKYKELTNTKLNANPDGNGRFHTDWLNMMYPRILLASKLLTDDGVLFISMADTELKNLLNICEEIFSKNNIEIFVWKKKSSAGNTEKIIGVLTEYIVCCFKNKEKGAFNYKKIERTYNFKDDIGPYNLEGVEKSNLGTYARPTMLFDVIDPKTGKVFKPGKDLRWTIGKETFDNMIQKGQIYFDYKNNKVKRIKRPQDYEESENVFYNLLDNHGSLGSAKDELEKILGNREIFDTPKPVQLMTELLKIGSRKDSIVLDFFSGSATLAHAVMKLNAEDGGNRKFIMVQLPEKLDEDSEGYKAGYRNICDIGEERIRRSGEMILENISSEFNLFTDEEKSIHDLDVGFKVFKLETTNIRPWDGTSKVDENTIFDFTDTIKDGRTNLDVAYEIMLKYGVFDMPIKETLINNKVMFNVGEGYMLICLDNEITLEDVSCIAKLKPHCVVFKEKGFDDDNVKINATYTLERLGVEDVKCI